MGSRFGFEKNDKVDISYMGFAIKGNGAGGTLCTMPNNAHSGEVR